MTNANAGVNTTTNVEGSMRRLGGRTKRSRASPCAVARARTFASRSHCEATPECSSHPSVSTTTHEHDHDDVINNNSIRSLTTTAPTEDHNDTAIEESSTIACDASGCGSEIGAFFTNLGTIAEANDCVKKITGGDTLNHHQNISMMMLLVLTCFLLLANTQKKGNSNNTLTDCRMMI